jgi:phage shock protein C
MTKMSSYALDKRNAKVMGVCAGLARSTGWDPTLVGVGTAALALFAFPGTILLYVLGGAIAPPD